MSRRTRGFTLVELLSVVAVTAVLLALLMPAIASARRQAQLAVCMSNMRQLGLGLLSYAHDSRGWFPAPATAEQANSEDWVYWQPDRDLSDSRIFPYIGRNASVLSCPGWTPDRQARGGYPPYPFSYSVNHLITGDGGLAPFGHIGWSKIPCNVNRILLASQKALLIEEDVTVINDGDWYSSETDYVTGIRSSVSVHHQRGHEIGAAVGGEQYWSASAGRGPVCFVDGHCDVIGRTTLAQMRYVDPRNRD